MLWMLLILLLATPVRLEIHIDAAKNVSVRLLGRVWGLPFRRRMELRRQGLKMQLFTQVEQEPFRKPPEDQLRRGMVLLGTLLRTDKARRSLLRAIDLLQLDVRLAIGFQDASVTALATGMAAGVVRLLPRKLQQASRIRIAPDFLRQRTQAQVRCIIFFHLGSLLPAAALTLAAAFLEAREHRAAPKAEEV